MEFGLTGRVALVTGAGSGIGRSIAQMLAAEGTLVYCTDIRRDAAEETAAPADHMTAMTLDVGDRRSIDAAIAAVLAAEGHIDVLVTSAGLLTMGPVMQMKQDDWEQVERVNLRGVLHCIHAVATPMVQRGHGRIINIASVSAFRGGGSLGNVLYGTTKAGVAALTMGFARELGPHGITVNAVAPAVTTTPMTETLLEDDAASIVGRIPLGHLTNPEDTAALATFLASDRAAFINGTIIPVDGGFLTT